MIWITLLLNFTGLTAFACGMNAHHRAFFAHAPTPRARRRFKALGVMLQSFALSAAIVTAGLGVGFVEWIAGLAACGFALTLLLSARPRRAR